MSIKSMARVHRHEFHSIYSLMMTLFIILAACSGSSDDPQISKDAQIQAMQSEIFACMQQGPSGADARLAFSQKYNAPLNQVEEIIANGPGQPPGTNGGWDEKTALVICALEWSTGIGALIWQDRAEQDKYKRYSGLFVAENYCVDYSKVCDHYNWQKGCLSRTVWFSMVLHPIIAAANRTVDLNLEVQHKVYCVTISVLLTTFWMLCSPVEWL